MTHLLTITLKKVIQNMKLNFTIKIPTTLRIIGLRCVVALSTFMSINFLLLSFHETSKAIPLVCLCVFVNLLLSSLDDLQEIKRNK